MNVINNDLKSELSDKQNQNDFATKEQYVTVITLNDSAYGEIQKVSPRSELSLQTGQNDEKNNEQKLTNDNNETQINNDSLQLAKNKLEPIYSNTLETQKSSDKGK